MPVSESLRPTRPYSFFTKSLYPLWRPFYAVFLVGNTLVLSLATLAFLCVCKNGEAVYWLTRFWARLNVAAAGVRIHTRGLEKIDSTRMYIVMSNHQSLFDVWALLIEIPLQLRWMVKREIRRVPLFGYVLEATGQVLVDRKKLRAIIHSLSQAMQTIESGFCLALFPEGTRSENGELLPFRKGGGLIACKTGIPILPVTINGSRHVLPKGTLKLMPGRIEIVVGDPIDSRPYDNRRKKELMDCVKSAIAANLDPSFGAP